MPGDTVRVLIEQKAAPALTEEEWKEYFAGHWTFGGARQVNHESQFPEELLRRLIRMFSFVGETVLDPFQGSGTTAKVATALGRSAVSYEINPGFIPLPREKPSVGEVVLLFADSVVTVSKRIDADVLIADSPLLYRPNMLDVEPVRDVKQLRTDADATCKISDVIDETTLRLDTGLSVSLLGVKVLPENAQKVREYFKRFLISKQVLLKIEDASLPMPVYLQLANKLFVNRKMIETGLGVAEREIPHRLQAKFIAAEDTLYAGQTDNRLTANVARRADFGRLPQICDSDYQPRRPERAGDMPQNCRATDGTDPAVSG